MPEKEKKSEFTVTDRRLFSSEGELRPDVVEAEELREEREQEKRDEQRRANEERSTERSAKPNTNPDAERDAIATGFTTDADAHRNSGQAYPTPPSASDQRASAEAYKESTREIDAEIKKELDKEGQGHRAKDFEMNFEKFIASLYMSTLMQLGMAAPEGGQPHVDLIGARQTIDIIGLLQEKTKGNLTSKEETMLQNVLYELRMAYLEVTNLITQAPPPGKGGNGEKR
jgi:hypothetical protein